MNIDEPANYCTANPSDAIISACHVLFEKDPAYFFVNFVTSMKFLAPAMRVTILEVVLAETPKERIKLSMQYAQSLCRALHLFRLVVQHGHPQTARDIALIKLVEYGHQIFDAFNVDPSDQARARGGQLVKEAFQYMRKSVLHDETELRDRLADILVCVGRAVFNARGYTTPGHPSSTHRWVDLLTEMDIHPPNFTVL